MSFASNVQMLTQPTSDKAELQRAFREYRQGTVVARMVRFHA